MKYRGNLFRTWAGIAAVIAVSIGAVGINAAASGTVSTGNIASDGRHVTFYSEDVDYLSGELDSLQGEVDYSVVEGVSEGGSVSASVAKQRDKLDSHGIINYDNGRVLISASDLLILADRTNELADNYAALTCRALNKIGTYFDAEGNVNHEAQTGDALTLGIEQLTEGIRQSQSIDDPIFSPIITDNLTAGTAAWVNGQCIIGNGADNDRAYRRGIEDGEAGNDDDVDIEYTYHVHTDAAGNQYDEGTVLCQDDDPGGCFVPTGHICDDSCIRTCKWEWWCYKSDKGSGDAYNNFYQFTHQCNQGTIRSSDWQVKRENIYWYAMHDYCEYMEDDESYSSSVLKTTSYTLTEITGTAKGSYWKHSGPDNIREYSQYIPGSVSTNIKNAPVNAWEIGCGKTVGQTETAIVTIQRNHKAEEDVYE